MGTETGFAGIEKLDGKNYVQWAFKVKTLLRAKGWLKFLEEEEAADNEQQRRKFEKIDAQVMNVIVLTVNMNQITYIINEKTARGAWQRLKERHYGKIQEKEILLRRKISNVKWESDDDVDEYILRVENLATSIRDTGFNLTDAEISSYILNGLPPKFRSIQRVYEAMKPSEITLSQLKNLLRNEEMDNKEREKNKKRVNYDSIYTL